MPTVQLLDRRLRRAAGERATLRVYALGANARAVGRLGELVGAGEGIEWLGATDSVRTADTVLRAAHPDVLVLHNTIDPEARLAAQLTVLFPWLAVVVLVDPGTPADRHAATGVHAVLPADAPPSVLVASIRLAHTNRSARAVLPAPGGARPRHMELSARQHEILSLIADGNSYAEVGQILFISTETVRTHAKQILRRLHARDRTHAVSLAYQAGLLGRTGGPATIATEVS
ncbi:response regulator transcription factor [Amycolatopsis sp. SID8362]|uniref:helix-turn-helix transcriptional regulator n=1 Tax=Amycolatopsis sp. SID8362 TaxID=2690346 RepID=UPI00136A2631|nr:response regulator transcription factor [Amycolatopsis sp. SID8362]NBH06480.1 DNA-binding response regulator [Amycolatopsis sp. SID8362]NED43177.1 response regulator transcription factor [Amycolatopsis sp. SID8362]